MTEILSDVDGLMSVKVSNELLQLFNRLRWIHAFKGKGRIEPGHILKLRDGARLSPYVGFYAGDHIPEIGSFSYTSSRFDRMTSIGAYSSISWNVRVMGESHPLDCFSTTAALYERHLMFKIAYEDVGLPEKYHDNPQKRMPIIGNDVWIGQDVLLGRGITIGDGAVVAAGSVVVKNVLPYEIVGGAPAKPIRLRFNAEERALLQWSRWWDYHMPALMSGPIKNVSSFVESLLEGISCGRICELARFSESLAQIVRLGKVTDFLATAEMSNFRPAAARDLTRMPRFPASAAGRS